MNYDTCLVCSSSSSSQTSILCCDLDGSTPQVKKDEEAANKVKVTVEAEEKEVKRQAQETQAIADDAKADLDKALPALEVL